MKTRESGMPQESTWEKFFDAPLILDRLGLIGQADAVVEFGCGYGTFTIPAARRAARVVAFDIEPAMIAATEAKAAQLGLANVRCELRDFVEQGTGLPDESVDYVLLFNILHAAEAPQMLAEARRILVPGGRLAAIHWNYDSATPRGPSLEIRPRPNELRRAVETAGFQLATPVLDLPPYHYGMVFRKGEA